VLNSAEYKKGASYAAVLVHLGPKKVVQLKINWQSQTRFSTR